ncbi:MAG: ATP-binding protein [Methanospirillum sp.]|uniref:sensor histidine kinase n=1 Tax=Methanospirillum sp. TaxID=45200 RepID=UPI0023737703|nr:ATP-binding protein [Methanospirillum sp.]MDD1728149.1 ATP-binding protein [Methanospirillum sp.]
MGIQEPVWHQVSAIIAKTRDSLNSSQVVTLDNTQNLEIFADPMFGQVIYNLVDYALRHGKSVTHICFSFESGEDGGVLIMADNGVGIADEDKHKIFQKGFGKNTGLGLLLIQEILTFSHITIKDTGKVGMGARFEIYIPVGRWRNTRMRKPELSG